MPCRDDYDIPVERSYHGLTGSQLEAVLCGVMTVLETASTLGNTPIAANAIADVFNRVDWKEAGVRREEASNWWKVHKQADEARRKAEEAERKRQEARASGLKKLTAEERRALGIIL